MSCSFGVLGVFANVLTIIRMSFCGWEKLEAAEKVLLYRLISCNYFWIVVGYFVSLSY